MQRTLNVEVVRALREAQGISLRRMALDIHRTAGHLSRVERGEHNASVATMAAIATRLGVSLDAISYTTDVAA